MTITFRCPCCTKEYRVADQWGGKAAKRQNCGQRLVVPQPAPPRPPTWPSAKRGRT